MSYGLGAATGLAVDRIVAEPPDRAHPVALLGRALLKLETTTYDDRKWRGAAHLVIAVAGTGTVGLAALRLLGPFLSTAAAVTVATAGSMLGDTASEIGRTVEAGDLERAQSRLRALVGRDPSQLDEAEIVRAVVESVAENTVDAVAATLFWAWVGGPVGVVVHRTVNTLDAMIGHRSARYANFGWASARADDLLNWAPARLSALTVAALRPRRAGEILSVVRRDGSRHPSPNGGVVEAAFAAALGVTLGGVNDYGGTIDIRGPLGTGPAPTVNHIDEAVRLSRQVAELTAAIGVLIVFVRRALQGS